MRMHVHGAGEHLRCMNNKPVKKFRNTFIYGYVKIYHRENYPLYTVHDALGELRMVLYVPVADMSSYDIYT